MLRMKVSIPNGMEFYSLTPFGLCPLDLVSIPNGMEFYAPASSKRFDCKRFQFPTGWNSTASFPQSLSRSKRFQFPTGWNSTLALKSSSPTTLSFNSQRDRILRVQINLSEIIKIVSIPNGMEFYRSRTNTMLLIIEFQFPTGWNST